MVEWPNGQMSNGQMAEWANVKWSNGQMVKWSNGQMVKWSNGQTVKRSNSQTVECQMDECQMIGGPNDEWSVAKWGKWMYNHTSVWEHSGTKIIYIAKLRHRCLNVDCPYTHC